MVSSFQAEGLHFATSICQQCLKNKVFDWWSFGLLKCFGANFQRFFSWGLHLFIWEHCSHHRYLLVKKKITWLWVCQHTDVLDVGFDFELLKKLIESFLDFGQVVFVLGNWKFWLKFFVAFIDSFTTVFDLLSGFSHRLLHDWKLKLVLLFWKQFV